MTVVAASRPGHYNVTTASTMDATKLRRILEHLDQTLEHPTELFIRGGAAVLGEDHL